MTAVEDRDLAFAKGTRGTVTLTAGEARLVDRLERIALRATARQRGNVSHAVRAERTGHLIDARAFRRIAEANRLAAQDAADVAADVRRGEFA